MLEIIAMYSHTSHHNNISTTGKQLIYEYIVTNIGELYSSDIEWYKYILDLCRDHNSGYGFIHNDLGYFPTYFDIVTLDVFISIFKANEARICGINDYYQKRTAITNSRKKITKLLYESKKRGRLDIYQFLLDNVNS